MERVLVTGATGLIGSHVAELFTMKGIETVCLVRESSDTTFLRSLGVKIVIGDITQKESLSDAFKQEITFVVHTAAKVGDWGKYSEFYDANVRGTLNVLEAAKNNNVRDLIITGSISVFGEESSAEVKDETYPYNSHYNYFLDGIFPSGMNHYRDTKAEANRKAIDYAKENDINLTVLDPAWVYGERELHSGFYDFVKTVKSGQRFVPGSRINKFHTIYARDLAEIYLLACQKRLTGVNEFLAVAPESGLQCELLDMMCQAAGLKPPLRIPKSIIYFPALIIEALYTLFGSKTAPLISRARVNLFYDSIEYSSAKLIRELGFTPRFSAEESVGNTVKWYKANNYL